jgi:glycosyltransferase involved in cell wall biosynthesis
LDETITVDANASKEYLLRKKIKIYSVETSSGRRKNFKRRLINYLSFSVSALRVSYKLPKQDLVIVGTPPLIVPIAGLLISLKHRAHSVLEIRDLYPETAVALGKLKCKLLIRLWERVENMVRSQYDQIVSVVPGITRTLEKKGFSSSKIYTITNAYDAYENYSVVLPNRVRQLFDNNEGKYIFVYAGGMGYSNNLKTILEAAYLCQKDPSILFVFFGEGELKNGYLKLLKKKNITNCLFFPLVSREIINVVFRKSYALMQAFWDSEFHKCIFTNKIFEYHGAGRPIVFAGNGDSAELVQIAKSGLVVEAEDPEAFADAVLQLVSDRNLAEQMGQSGKQYITRHYAREEVFEKWQHVLANASSKKQEQFNASVK